MKLLLSIVFIIFCKSSFSQIDIISESVIHPDSNVLFVGVDNSLKLKGTSINNYTLTAEDSEIFKFDGKFSIRVYNQGNIILKLYRNKKLVLSKPFRVETIPPMKAQLGGITDTVAKVSEILANPFLHVVIPGCSYKHTFSITSFRLDIITSDNDTISKSESLSNFISGIQLKAIKDLKVNDKLLLHQIYGNCPDCMRFKFRNFIISIE